MAVLIILCLVVIVIYFVSATEFQRIAEMKGHQGNKYFLWCLLCGPVGWAMVIALPDRDQSQDQTRPQTPAQSQAPAQSSDDLPEL